MFGSRQKTSKERQEACSAEYNRLVGKLEKKYGVKIVVHADLAKTKEGAFVPVGAVVVVDPNELPKEETK